MICIRKTRLFFKEGKSDKVYEIDLCRVSESDFVVNFRYGRRGARLREGTKTTYPVDRNQAQAIFDSVVVAKLNKGYQDAAKQLRENEGLQQKSAENGTAKSDRRVQIEHAVFNRFQTALNTADIKQIRRTVRRLGELSMDSAVADLMRLIPSKDELTDYTVAWALGRIGDNRAFDRLKLLYAHTRAGHVKHIAQEAMLATADDHQRSMILTEILGQLPRPVAQVIDTQDYQQLPAIISHLATQGGLPCTTLFEKLYQIAHDDQYVHRILVDGLKEIPFKAGFFKAIRRIYKAAEFRLDAEVFGLLAKRFDLEKSCFYRSAWGGDHVRLPGTWNYISFKKEISKPDSRLAYSNRTRAYLRQRIWRTLRRMGQCDDSRYVLMAAGLLLAFSDEDAGAPKQSKSYRWEQNGDGRWQSVCVAERRYGLFGGYGAFNHILHENSLTYRPASNGLSWLMVADGGPGGKAQREEAFPKLWDRHPQVLFKLLTVSRCAPVHGFAARALTDNCEFCRQLTSTQIIALLGQAYADTIHLGLALARKKYDHHHPDLDLIQALLDSALDAARRQSCQWLEEQPALLRDAAALCAHILTSAHSDIRTWGRAQIATAGLSDEQTQVVIVHIAAHLMGLDDRPDEHGEMISDVVAVFLDDWADVCRRIDLAVIRDLLTHPLTALQVLAAKLLLHHHTPAEKLPPDLIPALIAADVPQLRSTGVQLLARMPEAFLLDQADLIFSFCIAEDHEVRQAVFPLVKQLGEKHNQFGNQLFTRLMPYVFRQAPVQGFHQDLVTLLSRALTRQARQLDPGTIWRLLMARAQGARQLGANLLPTVSPDQFTVRQWAALGQHALLAVRQWVWQTYRDHRATICCHMADGLRLLDSDWTDTRGFALDFFRNNFQAADWRPELLVGICDSARDDVQRFGRELITTFFDDAHGVQYLSMLSQHPETDVQLFASNFLEQYAGHDLERLAALRPYFITVLSQVNRGRVAKARVIQYLRRQALESAKAAAVVAPIINRVAATIAVGDRGACVQILRDIGQKFPQVPTRLILKPVGLRPATAPEADHAI
jgi:predicted DNA-binding WGR domain protein